MPSATAGDRLGDIGTPDQALNVTYSPNRNQTPICGDVTGDGRLDVVAGASVANVAGIADTGSIYVWDGAALVVGTIAPVATLGEAVPTAGSLLASGSASHGLRVADLDGDGVLDLLAVTAFADPAGVANSGLVCFWRGEPTIGPVPHAADPYGKSDDDTSWSSRDRRRSSRVE